MKWIKDNSAIFVVLLGLIGYAEIRHRSLLSTLDQFKSEIRAEIEKNNAELRAEIQRNRETITEVRSLLMRHIEMHNTLAHACMPTNAKNRTAQRQNHSRIRKASPPPIAKQSKTKGVKAKQVQKTLPLTAKRDHTLPMTSSQILKKADTK